MMRTTMTAPQRHALAENGRPIVEDLSARKQRALVALMVTGNVRAAAQISEISERTLHRYLADEPFRSELLDAHRYAYAGALVRAQALAAKSIELLERIIDDPNAALGHRLAAVREVFSIAQRGFELKRDPQRPCDPFPH